MSISFSLIIRQCAIYCLLTIFITTIFVLSIFLGQEILDKLFGSTYWLSALLGALIVAICFKRLEHLTADTMDRVFSRKRYYYRQILRKTEEHINSMTRLKEILALLSDLIVKAVKVEQARIFFFDQTINQFVSKEFLIKFDADCQLVIFLEKTKQFLSWRKINNKKYLTSDVRHLLKQELKNLGSALIVPLIINNKLVAFFSLGHKLSAKNFSKNDLSFLIELAKQAALPLDRAQFINGLQEKIKDIERLNKITINRELKMVELKRAIENTQNNGQNNN